jgi:LDH2 family malate/lactate/ureidoglycolate dehydrogenase
MSSGSNYLDPDRPGAVRLSVGDARALGEAALARIGYDAEDAGIITDQLIDNALCGYRFAGLPRILAIAREAKTRSTRVPVAIVYETPVSALVDGGNNVGYVAVYRGAEIAIAKTRQSGIAAVGVYNSYFSGRNAYYLERIVNAGLVGLHTASSAPHIVPPGATRPALGTNPIAFGFPSADGPVIFDIVAIGESDPGDTAATGGRGNPHPLAARLPRTRARPRRRHPCRQCRDRRP